MRGHTRNPIVVDICDDAMERILTAPIEDLSDEEIIIRLAEPKPYEKATNATQRQESRQELRSDENALPEINRG